MNRFLAPLALAALLSGCGLAETASTTATLAEAEAQNARAAKETQAKIEQRLDEAQQAAAEQRKAAEAASE
ncbi:MAG: hypothetical protein ABI885_12150 [Gammaproteobacteria bacterium]